MDDINSAWAEEMVDLFENGIEAYKYTTCFFIFLRFEKCTTDAACASGWQVGSHTFRFICLGGKGDWKFLREAVRLNCWYCKSSKISHADIAGIPPISWVSP